MFIGNVQMGPKTESAISFDPFVVQTFALHFWKWQKIPKKLWRRVSSVPPIPPGLLSEEENLKSGLKFVYIR